MLSRHKNMKPSLLYKSWSVVELIGSYHPSLNELTFELLIFMPPPPMPPPPMPPPPMPPPPIPPKPTVSRNPGNAPLEFDAELLLLLRAATCMIDQHFGE